MKSFGPTLILFALTCALGMETGLVAQTIKSNPGTSNKDTETILFLSVIMRRSGLVEELGLTDEQIKEMYLELNQTFRDLHSLNASKNFRPDDKERLESINKQMNELTLNGMKVVNRHLAPHQIKRIHQLRNQQDAIKDLPSHRFSKDEVAKSFGLKKDSKTAIVKIEKTVLQEIRKLEEKHRKEMEQLLVRRDEKIKQLLNKENQAKYDRQFGKPVWFFLDFFMRSGYHR